MSRYLNFCLDFLFMYKNCLIRKKLNFKICDLTMREANNCNAHIAQYLKKGNQTVNLGQLIKFNTGNIFLEKSFTKCGGEIFSDRFINNENSAYLWINSLKFCTVSFCVYTKLMAIEDKLQTTCFHFS